jgi:hypothetical protein
MKKTITFSNGWSMILFVVSVLTKVSAQVTIPASQTLPYTQDFSSVAWTSNTYPSGWDGWEQSTAGSSSTYPTTAPTATLALQTSASATTTTSGVMNYNGKLGFHASGNSNPGLVLVITTQGHSNISVAFNVMTIRNPSGSNRINNVELQYRVSNNNNGTFTSVSRTIYSNIISTQINGTTGQNIVSVSAVLPAACNNKQTVQLRWVQKDSIGSTSERPSFAIDNISICDKATVTASGQTTFCSGGSVILTANSGTSYLWSTGQTTQSINASTTGSYSVTVSQGSCSTISSGSNVTVNSLPNVTVNSPTMCVGNSATLTATGASTYSWNTGATTASINVSPSVTTTYTVTGTDGNGCSKLATSTVAVNSLPSITVNSATICSGNTATLSVSGGNTYSWSTGETSPIINVSPASNKTYTVTGTDGNGCSKSATSSVSVNSLPNVTVNSAIICAESPVTLTAGGAPNILWSTGATTSTITVNPSSTTYYTVTGTNNNGCSKSVTSTVTVNPLPDVSSTSTVICNGETGTLDAGGAISYIWSSGETTASISPAPSATTIYTVTGIDVNGCSNSASGEVTVNQLPEVSVTSDTICSEDSATLVASGAITYKWSTGDFTSSIKVSPAVTTSYTVTGINSEGCSGSSVGTIIVNAKPVITLSALPSFTICQGTSTTISANGASTYSWNSGETTPSITVSPSSTTSYSVTGTDSKGCSSEAVGTLTVNSNPVVYITATSSPTVCAGNSIILTANGTARCEWSSNLNRVTTSTVTVIPTTTTVYTVTGTDTNSCSGNATFTAIVSNLHTTFSSGSSNVTTSNLNTNMLVYSCPGATSLKYVFTPSDGSTPFTKTVSPFNNYLFLGNISQLRYNKSYQITVQPFSGTEGGCISSPLTLNIGLPSATMTNCDAVISNLNSSILSTQCPGASSIEWLFTPENGGATLTKTISPFSNYLYLASIPGIKYGTVYTVQLRITASGVQGPYSSPCTVTINQPVLKPTACNVTIANMSDYVLCTNASGITGVEWSFAPTKGGTVLTKFISPYSNYLKIGSVPGIEYGTAYKMQVRGYTSTGTGPWSDSCLLTISQPTVTINSCNVNYTSLNSYILSSSVTGATGIQWEFTPQDGSAAISHTLSPFNNYLYLASVSGLKMGTNYSMRARAFSSTGSGEWSPACNLYFGTASRIANNGATNLDYENLSDDETLFNIYPNPSKGEFNYKTEINADIKIYNSTGALVLSTETSKTENQINLQNFGPGIYFMIITMPTSLRITKRLIVKN